MTWVKELLREWGVGMPETKTWVEKLIPQYSAEKRELEMYRDQLDLKSIEGQNDFDTVDEMIGDMNFALNWMRTGRRPGSRRGIEQKNVYKRTELAKHFPSIVPDVTNLTIEEKRNIVDILLSLSARERQCFLLYMVEGLTQEEIADRLRVSRTSVQKFLERAKIKVQKGVS